MFVELSVCCSYSEWILVLLFNVTFFIVLGFLAVELVTDRNGTVCKEVCSIILWRKWKPTLFSPARHLLAILCVLDTAWLKREWWWIEWREIVRLGHSLSPHLVSNTSQSRNVIRSYFQNMFFWGKKIKRRKKNIPSLSLPYCQAYMTLFEVGVNS